MKTSFQEKFLKNGIFRPPDYISLLYETEFRLFRRKIFTFFAFEIPLRITSRAFSIITRHADLASNELIRSLNNVNLLKKYSGQM